MLRMTLALLAVAVLGVACGNGASPPIATVEPRPMTQAVLYNHTATLLEDGRVLVTGGQTTERAQRGIADSPPPPAGVVSAEIYDPSTGSWSPTRPMLDPRRYHGAVRLEDGRVLVSGGLTDEYKPESTEGGRRVSILKWPEGALLNLG